MWTKHKQEEVILKLIVETDLGHDPDDFLALTWLIAAGVDIKLLLINPGDLDQIAFAQFLCAQLDLDIPILGTKYSANMSSGSIHHALLKKYGFPLRGKAHFSIQPQTIYRILSDHPDTEFFVIGPPKNTGAFLLHYPDQQINCLTMQGGFLPYSIYVPPPAYVLEKFERKDAMPTFNMNGAVKETFRIVESQNILMRRFIGKNVCHTMEFRRKRLDNMSAPPNRAAELFIEGMEIYLQKHYSKKFHDPTAAICMMRPEVGHWIRAKPCRVREKWTSLVDKQGDYVLADLNRTFFWEILAKWNRIIQL